MPRQALVVPFAGSVPTMLRDVWVAPTATLIGAVTLGEGSSVWFGAVVRADGDRIEVGRNSNIQDGSVLHADPGFPLMIGSGVSVGHGAVLHGCRVEDDVLIGMGATVLNGARVGHSSILAAGTLILEEVDIPPGSLVAGVPGRVRRSLSDGEVGRIRANASDYLGRREQFASILGTEVQCAAPGHGRADREPE